jgi:hypothetical protein
MGAWSSVLLLLLFSAQNTVLAALVAQFSQGEKRETWLMRMGLFDTKF